MSGIPLIVAFSTFIFFVAEAARLSPGTLAVCFPLIAISLFFSALMNLPFPLFLAGAFVTVRPFLGSKSRL